MSFGVVDNIGNTITIFFSEFSCSDAGVDPQNFADEESKPTSNSLDFLQCEWYSPFAINIGVEDTVDMLELSVCVLNHQRHLSG